MIGEIVVCYGLACRCSGLKELVWDGDDDVVRGAGCVNDCEFGAV